MSFSTFKIFVANECGCLPTAMG